MTYVSALTLAYGQILDGAVAPMPGYLSVGIISLYRTGAAAPFCTLMAGVVEACPDNSTVFDVGHYTLSGTLTFPPGTPFQNFDTNVGPCQTTPPSTTCDVDVTILPDTSTLTVAGSPNPSPAGLPVTFTATATGGYGATPTGEIIFTIDGSPVPAVALDGIGKAGFSISTLAIGQHTITASYAGALDFLPAPDAHATETILPPNTATTLTSSVNPSIPGQNVTFTADVATSEIGVHPGSAVSFADGANTFATMPVSSQGIASASIATLASGTHNITANYLGDAATGPSTAALVQQVTYPLTEAASGFVVTVTPSPVVLGVGLTADLKVTVTPRGGLAQPVTLTCADLPHESTCAFADAVIPAGGGSTTLGLHVTSPHDCGSSTPYFYGANRSAPRLFGYSGTALAGLLLCLLPGRRRGTRSLLALCACLGLTGLSGCSSTCTDFGTYPGSYTFKVIGTAPSATNGASSGNGTPLVVPISVALTVKI